MNGSFLSTFMRVAKTVTSAERGMAVDQSLSLLDVVNLPDEKLHADTFQEVAIPNINRALERHEPIITNNMITDPSQAPVTKTSFADLRVVVVIPVQSLGAVYLDQPIRYGIISRAVIDKLMRLGTHIVENQMEEVSEAELLQLYKEMD
jgi:hypothetical protein